VPGSTPSRRAQEGPFVYRSRTPASHAGKMGSIPIRVTDIAGAAGAQLAFISPVCPARYRDLQLMQRLARVSQCSFWSHKPEPPGATPGPATFSGRVRKSEKRSRRGRGDFVGSTPTSVNNGPVVQRRRRLRDMQEDQRFASVPLVQLQPGSLARQKVCRCFWWHTAVVRRKAGFNSRADLSQHGPACRWRRLILARSV
jgi:hypothetical protein